MEDKGERAFRSQKEYAVLIRLCCLGTSYYLPWGSRLSIKYIRGSRLELLLLQRPNWLVNILSHEVTGPEHQMACGVCTQPLLGFPVTRLCLTLWPPHGLLPARLLCPWDVPGKNTGVRFHALLQGVFLAQGSNPGFPHCRRILYRLSHQVIYTKSLE